MLEDDEEDVEDDNANDTIIEVPGFVFYSYITFLQLCSINCHSVIYVIVFLHRIRNLKYAKHISFKTSLFPRLIVSKLS